MSVFGASILSSSLLLVLAALLSSSSSASREFKYHHERAGSFLTEDNYGYITKDIKRDEVKMCTCRCPSMKIYHVGGESKSKSCSHFCIDGEVASPLSSEFSEDAERYIGYKVQCANRETFNFVNRKLVIDLAFDFSIFQIACDESLINPVSNAYIERQEGFECENVELAYQRLRERGTTVIKRANEIHTKGGYGINIKFELGKVSAFESLQAERAAGLNMAGITELYNSWSKHYREAIMPFSSSNMAHLFSERYELQGPIRKQLYSMSNDGGHFNKKLEKGSVCTEQGAQSASLMFYTDEDWAVRSLAHEIGHVLGAGEDPYPWTLLCPAKLMSRHSTYQLSFEKLEHNLCSLASIRNYLGGRAKCLDDTLCGNGIVDVDSGEQCDDGAFGSDSCVGRFGRDKSKACLKRKSSEWSVFTFPPTSAPTHAPTHAPTTFACSNAISQRHCRSLKYRRSCMFAHGKCTEKTAYPTRSPTVFPTKRPTGVPTGFACSNAISQRQCRSLKYRRSCMFAKGKCIEKTAYPTRAPTVFACDRAMTARACRSKHYRALCKYDFKLRSCIDRE